MGAPQGRLGPAVEALATLLTSRDPVRCPPLRPRSPQPVVWRTIGDALARRFGDPNQVKLDSLKDARDITERLYLVVPESLSTDDENEAYAWVSGFKTAVLATPSPLVVTLKLPQRALLKPIPAPPPLATPPKPATAAGNPFIFRLPWEGETPSSPSSTPSSSFPASQNTISSKSPPTSFASSASPRHSAARLDASPTPFSHPQKKSLSHIQALFPALPITGRPLVSPSSSYSELSQSPSDSSDASSPPSSITSTSASSIASTSACSAPSQPLPGPSPPAPPTSRRHGHPFHLSTHASTPRKPFGSFPATLPTPADPRPSSPDLTPDEYEAYAARKAPRVARRKSWWRFGLEKDDLEGGKGKGRKRDLSPDEDGEKEDGGSTKRRRSERVATWVANPEAPESPKRKRTRTRLPVVIEEEEEDDELECEDVDEGYGTEDDNGVYCVCDGPAYGTMVACDSGACLLEWFHLECTPLKRVPDSGEAWICNGCRADLETPDDNPAAIRERWKQWPPSSHSLFVREM